MCPLCFLGRRSPGGSDFRQDRGQARGGAQGCLGCTRWPGFLQFTRVVGTKAQGSLRYSNGSSLTGWGLGKSSDLTMPQFPDLRNGINNLFPRGAGVSIRQAHARPMGSVGPCAGGLACRVVPLEGQCLCVRTASPQVTETNKDEEVAFTGNTTHTAHTHTSQHTQFTHTRTHNSHTQLTTQTQLTSNIPLTHTSHTTFTTHTNNSHITHTHTPPDLEPHCFTLHRAALGYASKHNKKTP